MSVLEKLHVEIRGTGNPLLLFVPGWGCDRTVWSLLTPLLEGRFRIATFDPSGFGKSEEALTEPGGWSLSVTCEDITAVLGALGAPRAVVVGSSLGGMAALRLASAPPLGVPAWSRLVRLLVRRGSPTFPMDSRPRRRRAFWRAFEETW